MFRTCLRVTVSGLALALAACGSSGSNSGSIGLPVPPAVPKPSPGTGGQNGAPAPAPAPVLEPLPNTPAPAPLPVSFDTAEYRLSNGAVLTNAVAAWQRGFTGQGVKIGIVDSGINTSIAEFEGRIDPASRDVASDRTMSDSWGHGTAIASIASAARNAKGMQGLAYNSTIIMVKAAHDCSSSGCSFRSDDIEEGIRIAAQAGAKAINLSLAGDGSDGIEDAVTDAVNAGAVVVVAAGNGGGSNPSEMAQEIAIAGRGGAIIVGGLGGGPDTAVDYDQLNPNSHRAGDAMASYLAAPGRLVWGTMLNGQPSNYSGTSFAAPVVTGAVALLTEAFPKLTPQQVVSLLFTTADDLGQPGVDRIFGHGRLNLTRAFQPVGATTLAATTTAISLSANGVAPAASGDAVENSTVNAVVLDEYARAFSVNLGKTLRAAEPQSLLESALLGDAKAGETDFGGIAFHGSVAKSSVPEIGNFLPSPLRAAAIRELPASGMGAVRFSDRLGVAASTGFSARSLRNDLTNEGQPRGMITRDGLTLDLGGREVRSAAAALGFALVDITIAAETGSIAQQNATAPKKYHLRESAVKAGWGRYTMMAGVTALRESGSILGGIFHSALASGGSTSSFFDASVGGPLKGGWTFLASARRGRTNASTNSIATSAYSLAVAKASAFKPSDEFAIRLTQPLRVETGGLQVVLPVTYDYLTESISYSATDLSLRPTGREVATEASYWLPLPRGYAGFNLFARFSPGHRAEASTDVGAALRIKMRF